MNLDKYNPFAEPKAAGGVSLILVLLGTLAGELGWLGQQVPLLLAFELACAVTLFINVAVFLSTMVLVRKVIKREPKLDSNIKLAYKLSLFFGCALIIGFELLRTGFPALSFTIILMAGLLSYLAAFIVEAKQPGERLRATYRRIYRRLSKGARLFLMVSITTWIVAAVMLDALGFLPGMSDVGKLGFEVSFLALVSVFMVALARLDRWLAQ
jgi:hypothetical protein